MKKIVIMLMMILTMLSVAYANEVSLKELEGFCSRENDVQVINVVEFNANENLVLSLEFEELEKMHESGITKLEVNMHYLDLKIMVKELLNKGDIKLSSDYKDDLYYVEIYSSKFGELCNFNTNLQVTIPYEIDEEAYHITMYGVDENEQIINLRGFMDEETKTVSAYINNIKIPFIPVVNKIVYEDLGEYSWAKTYIEEAAAKGILSGKREGIYAPEQKVTRAEFVTLLLNSLNLDIIDNKSNFSDVGKKDWYCNYVVTADYYDLVSGVGESQFLPEESITRQDIVVMIGKAAEKFYDIKVDTQSYEFSDEEEISSYAVPYLKKCLAMELISGYEDETFRPEEYATRAEAAVIINKFFDKINKF